jgi:hypothetical protein
VNVSWDTYSWREEHCRCKAIGRSGCEFSGDDGTNADANNKHAPGRHEEMGLQYLWSRMSVRACVHTRRTAAHRSQAMRGVS